MQHHPSLYLIFWGANWNGSGAASMQQLLTFYRGLSGSAWQSILTRYADTAGPIAANVTIQGQYVDGGVAAPSGLTRDGVQREIAAAIAANGWAAGPDAQFVVLTPPGSTYDPSFPYFDVTNESPATFECGFHGVYGSDATYSVVPYQGDAPFAASCLGYDLNGDANHVTSMLASHEYAESVTDPRGDAWYTNEPPGTTGFEIADVCATGDAVLPNGSWVQGLWDDVVGDCELADLPAKQVAAGSGGLQMALDRTGAVWARSGVGDRGWVLETPSPDDIVAIAAGGSTQMALDSTGLVWAKSTIGNGGWTPETPAGEHAIAAGADGSMMLLDGANQVWGKASVIGGGWTQETPAGETQIADGGGGLQMLLDGAAQVWAVSFGNGGWTQETPAGEHAISASAGGLQMLLDGGGQVWAKTSIGNGGWTQETGAGQRAIAAGADGTQVRIDGSGGVWARSGIGSGGWVLETPEPDNIASIADGSATQMALDSNGVIWARSSIGNGGWTPESPGL